MTDKFLGFLVKSIEIEGTQSKISQRERIVLFSFNIYRKNE